MLTIVKGCCRAQSGYPRCTGIPRHSGWGRLDVPGFSGLVWVSSVYGDTQTHCMVGDSWMSPDCPGWSGYPWCTWILRHSGWGRLDVPGLSGMVWVSSVYGDTQTQWLDVPGLSGMVWVSSMYGDTQTQWLGTVGCPRIVRDGLGILGVRGYPDTVVGEGWMSRDYPGWCGYTEIQDIVGWVFIRILGQVSPVLLGLSKEGRGCGGSCLCNLDIQS